MFANYMMTLVPESRSGSWQSLGHRGAECRRRCLHPRYNFWEARCSLHSDTLCPVQTCGLLWTWVCWHVYLPSDTLLSQGIWLASSQLTWLLLWRQPTSTWPTGQWVCWGQPLCEPVRTFYNELRSGQWAANYYDLVKPGRVRVVPLLVFNSCGPSCLDNGTLDVRSAPVCKSDKFLRLHAKLYHNYSGFFY